MQVLGLDIAPVQPQWYGNPPGAQKAILLTSRRVPPNCIFEIDDVEMPWTLDENSYDFIHARDLLLSIRDWPKLVDQCYKYVL